MRAHPLERQTLVKETVIARRAETLIPERAVAKEPERSESIVGRDDDDIVRLHESLRVRLAHSR